MGWLLMVVCLCLTACNDNDEPKNDVELAITEQFQPCSVTVCRSDSAFTEMCERWGNRTVVVNSADELPDDPMGFSADFGNISFANQTLLLYYMGNQYDIQSCSNRYYQSVVDESLNWLIIMGVGGDIADVDKTFCFTRFAILVPKLTDSSSLKIWLSVQSLSGLNK
jgi:hypothetical protein